MTPGAEAAGGIAHLHRVLDSSLQRILAHCVIRTHESSDSTASALLRRIEVEARSISEALTGMEDAEPQHLRQDLLANSRVLLEDAMRLEGVDKSDIDEIRKAARELLELTSAGPALRGF